MGFDDFGHVRELKVKESRAQSLAVGIERERSRNAASKRIGQNEIERTDHRQFIACHLASCDFLEMCPHPVGRNVLAQEIIMRLVEGDDGDVRGIAFVSGSGMSDVAQFHDQAHDTNT
jgi:hypothetical protein